MAREPIFLTLEQIREIHRDQINEFGGIHGLRDEWALESAIAQPLNVHFYDEGDLYEIAPAYAFHIAESQAHIDGNRRTGMQVALDFLEINGVDASNLPELAAYEAITKLLATSWIVAVWRSSSALRWRSEMLDSMDAPPSSRIDLSRPAQIRS